MTVETKIKTPCVGRCSTIYGDVVCRGCKRYCHEIIDWNSYTVEQRYAVIMRLDTLLTPLVEKHFELFDESLLRQQMEKRGIRFLVEQSPYCWAYNLLVKGAAHIKQLEKYGLRCRVGCEEGYPDLVGLREQIDREFFKVSESLLKNRG